MLEYYANGDVRAWLDSKKELTLQMQRRLLKGVAAGMAHLHEEKIIHRDLAAR